MIVGGVLMFAALLKLRDGTTDSVGDLFSPAVRFVALQAELLIAVWLLSGWAPRAAWLTAPVLFCGLAAASVGLGIAGRSDCGCFGRIAVSPWVSCAIDAGCVVLLLVARPRGLADNLRGSAAVVVGLGVLGLAAVGVVGSPFGESTLARIRGEHVRFVSSVQDLGDAPEGTVRVVKFELVNRTNEDVAIIGGSFTCTCMATDGLRFVVPARGTATFDIQVTYKGSPGRFGHNFELFTDQSGQQKVRGRVSGTVSDPRP